jgi:hypothetical protein
MSVRYSGGLAADYTLWACRYATKKSSKFANQIKNTGVIHQHFFQKVPVVSAILYLFSVKIFF